MNAYNKHALLALLQSPTITLLGGSDINDTNA